MDSTAKKQDSREKQDKAAGVPLRAAVVQRALPDLTERRTDAEERV